MKALGKTQHFALNADRVNEFQRSHLTISVALNSLTSDLDVGCTNRMCTWTGKYPDAEAHDKACLFKHVYCPNNCSQGMMQRREIQTHVLTCEKQTVPCPDCKKCIARDGMETHKKASCIYSRVFCPLGCGLNLDW